MRQRYQGLALNGHVQRQDLRLVRRLLSRGAPLLDARNSKGDTPLHTACNCSSHRDYETPSLIVEALLDAGADVDAVNANGMTPLVCAIVNHHRSSVRVVEVLLERGADPRMVLVGHHEFTPLHAACDCGNLDAFQALIRRLEGGSTLLEDLTARNLFGGTPFDRLHCLPRRRREHGARDEMRRLLLRMYAEQLAHREGPLALHAAFRDARIVEGLPGRRPQFRLTLGRLEAEDLPPLVEHIVAAQPDAVETPDDDGDDGGGLLPFQVASLLGLPIPALYALLRAYPDALLLPSNNS